ncbi:hypothetical protein HUW51_17390 [Adhaeribacter swui]|uniref:Uncharacterized protein n=1 Tax=Adhaeribacter swui TaxID=2086471 RepID=A0A7G7GB76_9BACT|nr:hypothetical protein [Adhaeribacter swui]QNF34410.1 hypothetical protein HUW51_17390 [Adhaeribacter swui]
MAKDIININEDNLEEWMHSVGYFLPRSEKELNRFERLNPEVTRSVKDDEVDPFAILNGSWKPKAIVAIFDHELNDEIQDLRMAARNNADISQDVIEKMKANQKKKGESDNTKG